jgi:hypothetical protein
MIRKHKKPADYLVKGVNFTNFAKQNPMAARLMRDFRAHGGYRLRREKQVNRESEEIWQRHAEGRNAAPSGGSDTLLDVS